jgi:membrane protein implicated in regulation of membrane protease activity
MVIEGPTFWWLLAGTLVAVELATGTFYLLMLALGAVAGALVAHAGFGASAQIVASALLGALATLGWHARRARNPRSAPAQSNRDVLLDIGQTLAVEEWASDGTARTQYRGAAWSVRFTGQGTPAPGRFRIVAIDGNELAVTSD